MEHQFRTPTRIGILSRAALLAVGVASVALVATGRPVAASVGPSTDALLTQVSDSIAYEMYPGVFRGAAATLAEAAGNDLDQGAPARDAHPRLGLPTDVAVCELHAAADRKRRAGRGVPGPLSSTARPRRVRGTAERTGDDGARTGVVRAGRRRLDRARDRESQRERAAGGGAPGRARACARARP
jgi:hypothetical protein